MAEYNTRLFFNCLIFLFCKVVSGCDTTCEFPFSYRNYTFENCNTLQPMVDKPWCITNQELFDSFSKDPWTRWNNSRRGWSYCAKNCPEEEKICSSCQTKWYFRKVLYNSCTEYKSYYIDENSGLKWKWCITDQTKFDLSYELVGWKYCSKDCSKKNDYSVYFIFLGIVVFAVLLSTILCRKFMKFKHKNIRPDQSLFLTERADNDQSHSSVLHNKTKEEEDNNLYYSKVIFVHNQIKTHGNDKKSYISPELKRENKVKLLRHLSGDPDIFDAKIGMKGQGKVIPYNTKREIDRSNFTIDEIIGSGNFGEVYKGTLNYFNKTEKKIPIAIKTINSFETNAEYMAIEAFIGEIKIMSNVDYHLNIVNMIGSCTSEFAETSQLWLLLEYCPHGDLKTYLIANMVYQ